MSTATKNVEAKSAETVQSNGAPEVHFKLVDSQTRKMAKAQALLAAEEHHNLPKSPTERDLDARRVRELVDRIEKGEWLPCTWATVMYGGVKYRMNGQHSSRAMMDAADHLPDPCYVHHDHYNAESADGMGLLFRQFDARFSGRSKADVSGAYKGLVPELDNVQKPKAKLGIEGIAWYERVIEKLPVPSGDDVYQLLFRQQYHPFLVWLEGILSLKTPELMRAAIVGAMYGTFLASGDGATEFWKHVALADLADDQDPRYMLSVELVKLKEDKKGVRPPAPIEFYAKCVTAWRGYRTGEKVRTLNVNTKKGLPNIAA